MLGNFMDHEGRIYTVDGQHLAAKYVIENYCLSVLRLSSENIYSKWVTYGHLGGNGPKVAEGHKPSAGARS